MKTYKSKASGAKRIIDRNLLVALVPQAHADTKSQMFSSLVRRRITFKLHIEKIVIQNFSRTLNVIVVIRD